MAPEQAAADPHLDQRVDIYAVGAVAYELLTGRPVFLGTTPQLVLSQHVTEAPEPVTRHRATVPAALEAVVMRCLAKKPADRWQSADELLSQLEGLLTPSGGITPTDTRPLAAAPGRKRLAIGSLAAAAIVALLGGTVLVTQLARSKPLTVTISDITPVTSAPGVEFEPAISPDGQEVAFVAGPIGTPHLVIRSTANVAGGGEVRLSDTSLQSEWFPSWTTDGAFVRFSVCRAEGCAWSRMGKLGGAPRSVAVPDDAFFPAWSPDGARVAFTRGGTIFTSAVAEPVAHRVAVVPSGYPFANSLAWSPDGTRIAFVDGNPSWQWRVNVAPSAIWVVDAAGGEPQRVTQADCLNASPAWLDASHLLFVSNRDGPRGLYVVEVGPSGARGEARPVPGVADPHSISYSTAARKLAYAKLTLRQNIWAYRLDRAGTTSIDHGSPVTNGSQVIETHDVSPDGEWLAYDSNLRGNMDLYKLPLAGGEPIPLTDLPGDEFNPQWSPDGREIALYMIASGTPRARPVLGIIPAGGGAPITIDGGSGGDAAYPFWSPSGRDIAFWSYRSGTSETWLVSRDSVRGTWHEPVQLTDFGCWPMGWVPDGSGVLCLSQGRGELVVVSRGGSILRRDDLRVRDHLTVDPGPSQMRFSRDGSTLYLKATHDDGRSGIWAVPWGGGAARLVVAADDPALLLGNDFSLNRDRLYLTVSQYESDIWVMNLRY
jgi:Tol biopolymer transport system component